MGMNNITWKEIKIIKLGFKKIKNILINIDKTISKWNDELFKKKEVLKLNNEEREYLHILLGPIKIVNKKLLKKQFWN
jgi:hypothetical protein